MANNELTQTIKKSGNKTFYLVSAIGSAILSSIPMMYFVNSGRYQDTWLLFLGDAIFLFLMIGVTVYINRTKDDNATTGSMIIAGHWITLMATIAVCLITFIVVWINIPDLFGGGGTGRTLTREPSNMVEDSTDGLLFILFAHAILATFSAGSFATLITAYTIKKDQRKDRAEI
jgi:hypothetical protein